MKNDSLRLGRAPLRVLFVVELLHPIGEQLNQDKTRFPSIMDKHVSPQSCRSKRSALNHGTPIHHGDCTTSTIRRMIGGPPQRWWNHGSECGIVGLNLDMMRRMRFETVSGITRGAPNHMHGTMRWLLQQQGLNQVLTAMHPFRNGYIVAKLFGIGRIALETWLLTAMVRTDMSQFFMPHTQGNHDKIVVGPNQSSSRYSCIVGCCCCRGSSVRGSRIRSRTTRVVQFGV